MSATERVGRFEVNLGCPLGHGGFGEVFRAVDRTATPPLYVAAKRSRRAADMEMLRKEARALDLVAGHPFIIELLDFIETPGGQTFLFLEFCGGGDLFDRAFVETAPDKRLSERAARPIVRRIAEALRHCLSRGVSHRDLKFENVMLSAEDPTALKLIDFGYACEARRRRPS